MSQSGTRGSRSTVARDHSLIAGAASQIFGGPEVCDQDLTDDHDVKPALSVAGSPRSARLRFRQARATPDTLCPDGSAWLCHAWPSWRSVVRAAGLEPARLFRAEGFSYHFGFRRLAVRVRARLVCGLDYTFTIAHSRFRCCPSSLYTFATRLSAGALGSGLPVTGFPEFEQFCTSGFPAGTQFSSPLRLPIPPRPLWSQDQIVSAVSAAGKMSPPAKPLKNLYATVTSNAKPHSGHHCLLYATSMLSV